MNYLKQNKGERLCTFCGLCCEGYFHCKAYIYNQEDEKIAEQNNAIIFKDADDRLCFVLPCPVYNQLCTVYPKRPLVCIKHKCDLLKGVLDGTIPIYKALEIADQMKDTVQFLKTDLEKIKKKKKLHNISILMRYFYEQYPDNRVPPEIKKKHALRLLTYAKFLFLEKKYFYK